MFDNLKNYFHYTRGERNGFLVLIVLCVIMFFIPKMYPILFPRNPLQVSLTPVEQPKPSEKAPPSSKELFVFDPNTASQSDFEKLGLPSYIAERIVKYRTKGGSFANKKDLQKIYGLKPEDYERLEPYIKIAAPKTAYTIPNDIPASYDNTAPSASATPQEYTLFDFDPNTASASELARLGLPERVIATIIKFRNRGQFRKPEDFAKIFGLSKRDYQRLYPYINIVQQENSLANKTDFGYTPKAVPKITIDINQADAATWEKLYGIGPAYARRIVKFRNALGGFHSVQQIAETYGLPDSTFQKIKPQLRLGTPHIKKININTADAEVLQKHPYLSRKEASVIEKYRKNHGLYKEVSELQKIHLFDSAFVVKISPYLTAE